MQRSIPIEQTGAPRSAPEATAGARSELELAGRAPFDRDAFGYLYQTHGPAIFNYLLRRAGDRARAEDLLSETFLRALKSIHRFEQQNVSIRFWLYRIATNLANSAARRRRFKILLFGEDIKPDHITNPKGAPAEMSPARLRASAALARLPARDQAILVLRFVEDLSIEDTARILECPAGTVQSRTARARERLRRNLEQ